MDDFNDLLTSVGIREEDTRIDTGIISNSESRPNRSGLRSITFVEDVPFSTFSPESAYSGFHPSSELSDDDFLDILHDNGVVTNSTEGSEEQESQDEPELEEVPTSPVYAELDPQIVEEYRESSAEEENSSEENADEEAPEDYIPRNSNSFSIDESTSRFSGTSWYSEIKTMNVMLAGIGGIGSWAALQLARLGIRRMHIYDDDRVDSSNRSGQLYGTRQNGVFKTDALAETIYSYAPGVGIITHNIRYMQESDTEDIMICGFDNMEARSTYFRAWRDHVENISESPERCLFIDGRLSIDTYQIFCIKGTDTGAMDRYSEEYLFSDSDADETVCSMKQTSYMASMIGAMIANLFVNFVANLLDPVIPHDLPFLTEYEANNMIFKVVR